MGVCLGVCVFKRGADIVLAGLLLTISLPFLAIAAILIKLDSAGPVIFRQVRMGRSFRRFELFKLRTMILSSDGSLYTLGADPRVTRTGRWLRRYKFDELPQLWNVLRGDMSLVGPRPVIPELIQEFRQEYDPLLSVRPGLTDPATLKYFYESEMLACAPDPLHYFKTVVMPDKLGISRDYLQQATLWSDLGVMAGTALAFLSVPPKSWIRQAVSTLTRRILVSYFPESVRRRKEQPMIADALMAGPVELLVPQGNTDGYEYGSGRLAYRHLRLERVPREWDRERFRL
jgi:lipopolysaccharide/colanic/teichoic acid biosynthesis glycosyltransferase